jgi:hypothetical protein
LPKLPCSPIRRAGSRCHPPPPRPARHALRRHPAIANAGLLLAATLAQRLGIEQTADALIDLGERAGAAHPGRKLLTLVHTMIAGGDCIDDAALLRRGATSQVLGHRVMALGTFLRAFTFICEVHGDHKQGAAYGYSHTLG